jgi:hypothetical protein
VADVGGAGVVGADSCDGTEVVLDPIVGRCDYHQPVIVDDGTDQRATARRSVEVAA